MCTFNFKTANSNLSKFITLNDLLLVGSAIATRQDKDFYFVKLHASESVPFAINSLRISKALFELIKNQNNICCNAKFNIINGKPYLIDLDLLPNINVKELQIQLIKMIKNKLN